MCPLCVTTLALCATGGASAAGLAALLAKVVRASDSTLWGAEKRSAAAGCEPMKSPRNLAPAGALRTPAKRARKAAFVVFDSKAMLEHSSL